MEKKWRERERETDRQTDREKETKREKEREGEVGGDKQNGSGWKEKRLIRAQGGRFPRLPPSAFSFSFRDYSAAVGGPPPLSPRASCSLFRRGKSPPFPFPRPPSTKLGLQRTLINPLVLAVRETTPLPVHRSRGHASKQGGK